VGGLIRGLLMPDPDPALDDVIRKIAHLLATAYLRLRFPDPPGRVDSPETESVRVSVFAAFRNCRRRTVMPRDLSTWRGSTMTIIGVSISGTFEAGTPIQRSRVSP